MFDKYDNYPLTIHCKKECALITVDEIIDSIEVGFEDYKSLAKTRYWNEVKQEIEKL